MRNGTTTMRIESLLATRQELMLLAAVALWKLCPLSAAGAAAAVLVGPPCHSFDCDDPATTGWVCVCLL